jgi:hypothetical protein
VFLGLAAIMLLLVAAPAAAQGPIAVEIEGVGGALLENVRAHLSLERARTPRCAPRSTGSRSNRARR